MRTLGVHIRLFFIAIILILLTTTGHTSAQSVQDFVIESFTADYELTNDDAQGLLTITETIALDYSGQNRGILRAIPSTYKDVDSNPSVVGVTRDGATEPYITYEQNGNEVIRIGDENVYLTGKHTYVINYTVENVITFYEDYDELFWDINGDQWLQPFSTVEAQVRTDGKLKDDPKAVCYTGRFGGRESDCTIKQSAQVVESVTTRSLQPGETLTIVAAYEKGHFSEAGFFDRYRRQLAALPLATVLALVTNSARRVWEAEGKEYEKRGLVAPFFGRPKGLSVMQAAYVRENKLTTKAMSASIIDLAIRGYLTITERKSGRSVKHDITLRKKLDNHVSSDEVTLIESLVGTEVGKKVTLESKKNKLHKTYESLKKDIDTQTARKGFYDLSPKKAEKKLVPQLVMGIVGLVIGFFMAEYTHGISVAVGVVALVLIVLYRAFMSKRSQEGNLLVEHMEGLELYISQAEKDRIEQQDAVAAPLSHNAHQPVRDVKFFEKLLPFAVALGVEKTWADAFGDIYTEQPEWYSGNWNTFTTAHLVNGIASTSKAAATSFTPPSSSGSSGFSGGGFSGGGGGGGGGGGW